MNNVHPRADHVGTLLRPPCGFASEVAGNNLSEDQQWAKLELVRRVADRVWG